MKFSVCIPTYNRAYIIKNPLESLIKQTFQDFEVVVVDDGSTDNTEEIVYLYKDKLQLKYIKKQNGGKHTALNTLLDNAKGELFVILDSDDELVPNALERMNDIWETWSDKTNICGVIGKCLSNGKIIGRCFDENQETLSYVDFHFGKYRDQYGDCCECIKTDIINQYRWPEHLGSIYVQESYVMDQIGLKYSLITTNEVLEVKFYQEDGITLNVERDLRKNLPASLFIAVSKIEMIFPKAKRGEVTLRAKFGTWTWYWKLVSLDVLNECARVKKVSFIGFLSYLYCKLRFLK